jgi:hypothetical protein
MTRMQHSTARSAMIEAWSLARRGATIFGGPVRTYLAEALRQAWAELKADPVVQEVDKIISAIKARKAAGTWRHPATYRASYNPSGAWIGQ